MTARAGTGGKRSASTALDRLQDSLGYRFREPGLLEQALTHRSRRQEDLALAAQGAPRTGEAPVVAGDNETLEFLGDAILGFVVAEALRRGAAPEVEVGKLARRRSSLVSEASLAPRARTLGIGAALKLGRGEDLTGGREKASLLADAFEAVVAAIFLDGGLRQARAFIFRQFPEGFGVPEGEAGEDPKTRLQEILQAQARPLPEYRVISESGPDHARAFTVELIVDGKSIARGTGRTKKAAGTEAARLALERLGLSGVSAAAGRSRRGPRRRGGGRG
ncbi:MAG: ribonuclease III [Planctomycetes bacterium]|nr:ribonuclease III [Planctomycetota bacterium]